MTSLSWIEVPEQRMPLSLSIYIYIYTVIWKCMWELQETKLCTLLAASWLKLSCALFSGGADCECPTRILHAKTLRQIVTCFNPVRPEMRGIPHTPHFHKRVDVHSSHAWVYTSPRKNYLFGTWVPYIFPLVNQRFFSSVACRLGPEPKFMQNSLGKVLTWDPGCPHQQGTCCDGHGG